MKARRKGTNDTFEDVSSVLFYSGGCILARDVEFEQESNPTDHWQNVRERAAIAAMQGTITILSNSDRYAFSEIVVEGYRGKEKTYPKEIAEFAVACADALVEKLKGE